MSHQAQAFSVVFSHHYNSLISWKSYVITQFKLGIYKGVPLGYNEPRCQCISHASAFQHPEIIDNELNKEVTAKRIIGPFITIPPYQTYSAPELELCPKNRRMMHLSTPRESSNNDGIDKEEFASPTLQVDAKLD